MRPACPPQALANGVPARSEIIPNQDTFIACILWLLILVIIDCFMALFGVRLSRNWWSSTNEAGRFQTLLARAGTLMAMGVSIVAQTGIAALDNWF
jgi:hypothetical protein